MNVCADYIRNVVNNFPSNKYCGIDGLTAKHIQLADNNALLLLSLLVTATRARCCNPNGFINSVIVPLIKYKNRRGNYRPIRMSI